jgi:hypothetical protein
MDSAFNIWFDQRRTDVHGLVDELFSRLTALVPRARRG